MKGLSEIPLILGRLRPSIKAFNQYTNSLSQYAAMRGGPVQPINFSKPQWAGVRSKPFCAHKTIYVIGKITKHTESQEQ